MVLELEHPFLELDQLSDENLLLCTEANPVDTVTLNHLDAANPPANIVTPVDTANPPATSTRQGTALTVTWKQYGTSSVSGSRVQLVSLVCMA